MPHLITRECTKLLALAVNRTEASRENKTTKNCSGHIKKGAWGTFWFPISHFALVVLSNFLFVFVFVFIFVGFGFWYAVITFGTSFTAGYDKWWCCCVLDIFALFDRHTAAGGQRGGQAGWAAYRRHLSNCRQRRMAGWAGVHAGRKTGIGWCQQGAKSFARLQAHPAQQWQRGEFIFHIN